MFPRGRPFFLSTGETMFPPSAPFFLSEESQRERASAGLKPGSGFRV